MSPYVNVSSRTAGDASGKEHNHVLADIGELIEKIERSEESTGSLGRSKFGSSNFIKSTYMDSLNREYPEYLLTRDFFTYIATGYRGEEAAESKIAYIRQGSGNE